MAVVFIVLKGDSYQGDHVLLTPATQEPAITWAKDNGHGPPVARVGHLTGRKIPYHWRAV